MPESRFDPSSTVRRVEPVIGLDAKSLRQCLPKTLQGHAKAGAFLNAVVVWCAVAKDMASDAPSLTTANVRDRLLAVEKHAHELQNAMRPLAEHPDEFESLHATFEELQDRASDTRDIAGGFVAPPLSELLRRLESDLHTLRVVCEHTTARFKHVRSQPEHDKRMLVRGVAELYRGHFGKLPPKRGLFGDKLIPHIAMFMWADIGHHIVGEVVAELMGEK